MGLQQLKSGNLPIWVSSFLTLLGGAGLGKLFDHPIPFWPVFFSVPAALAGLGLQHWLASRHRRYRRFETRQLRKIPAERRQVLIMPLSFVRTPLPDFVTISGDLGKDLDTLAERKRRQRRAGQRQDFWSWEQTLRGIYHHVHDGGPLTRLILLGSRDSVEQIGIFVTDVIRQYASLQALTIDVYCNSRPALQAFKALGPPLTANDGFDFEDFEALTNAFARLLDALSEQGIAAKNVQIDFTGGQKPTSVVAAAVTFFSNAANQYVATNPRDWNAAKLEYDVLGYDVREIRQADD